MAALSSPGDSQEPERTETRSCDMSEKRAEESSRPSANIPGLLRGRRLRFWLIVLVALPWDLAHFIHSNHMARSSSLEESLQTQQSTLQEARFLLFKNREL